MQAGQRQPTTLLDHAVSLPPRLVDVVCRVWKLPAASLASALGDQTARGRPRGERLAGARPVPLDRERATHVCPRRALRVRAVAAEGPERVDEGTNRRILSARAFGQPIAAAVCGEPGLDLELWKW